MAISHTIPTIDLSPLLSSHVSQTARQDIISQVQTACSEYGFFQITNHGVPLPLQRQILAASQLLFALPQEQKDALSLKNSPARRGYERIGEQTLDKAALPDRKEGFYIGVESPNPSFLRGPNQWPPLPPSEFKDIATAYHQHMLRLAATLVELLVQGLGREPQTVAKLTEEPVCNLKLLHYPPRATDAPDGDVQGKGKGEGKRQFGAGAHTDFGILTILLQQPGKIGLQVRAPEDAASGSDSWLPVPAVEDVLIVNVGDMLGIWTKGVYKSALHRVVHESEGDRYSVPCFWEGSLKATNPFVADGEEGGGETVEEHVRGRYVGSYGL